LPAVRALLDRLVLVGLHLGERVAAVIAVVVVDRHRSPIIAAGGGRGHSRERPRIAPPSASNRNASSVALPFTGRRHHRDLQGATGDRRVLYVALQVGRHTWCVPRSW